MMHPILAIWRLGLGTMAPLPYGQDDDRQQEKDGPPEEHERHGDSGVRRVAVIPPDGEDDALRAKDDHHRCCAEEGEGPVRRSGDCAQRWPPCGRTWPHRILPLSGEGHNGSVTACWE